MHEHLTGRNTGTRSATLAADQIVVATLIDQGQADAGAPGQAYFGQAQARTVRWLRGPAPPDPAPGAIAFNYTVQRLPDSVAEQAPVVGRDYIFFLRLGAPELAAFKILGAEANEILAVEELLAKRP